MDLWAARLRRPAHNPTGLDYEIVRLKSNPTGNDEEPLLFVTCNVSKVPMSALVRELVPFLWAHGVVLVILTFVPALSTWLPRALGFK